MSKIKVPSQFSVHEFQAPCTIFRSKRPESKEEFEFLISLGCRRFVNVGSFPSSLERKMTRDKMLKLVHFPLGDFRSIGSAENAEDYAFFENQVRLIMTEVTPTPKTVIYDDDGFTNIGPICALLRRVDYWSQESWIKEFLRFAPSGWWDQSIIDFIENFDITDYN